MSSKFIKAYRLLTILEENPLNGLMSFSSWLLNLEQAVFREILDLIELKTGGDSFEQVIEKLLNSDNPSGEILTIYIIAREQNLVPDFNCEVSNEEILKMYNIVNFVILIMAGKIDINNHLFLSEENENTRIILLN